MSASTKRCLSALALGFLLQAGLPGRAQGTPAPGPATSPSPTFTAQEVGVDEKLGQTAALDVPLKDEEGRPVTLRALLDKPTILTMNYFRCAGICTPQLNGLTEVLNRVQAVPGKDFQVITVSFDPRDTPEMALQKRTNYLGQITRPFPPTAWRFLTGDEAATRALADSLGFKYKRVGEDYIHAGAAMMLSPQGKVTRYLYGITYIPADVDMAIQEAARGEANPSINKLLQFCFSYDPQGRKYVLNFTKLSMAITLAAVLIFAIVLVLKGRGKSNPKEGA